MKNKIVLLSLVMFGMCSVYRAQSALLVINNTSGCDIYITGWANSSCSWTGATGTSVCVPAGTSSTLPSIGNVGDDWIVFQIEPSPNASGCVPNLGCGHTSAYAIQVTHSSYNVCFGLPQLISSTYNCPCGSSLGIDATVAGWITILP